VGRFVLDGALDPSLPYGPFRRDQAMAMDQALGRFLADCHSRPDCSLPPESAQAIAAIQGLVAGLDARPYQSSDGRQLSGARALGVIQSSMYDPPSAWKPLQQALAAALRGDLEPMLVLADGPDLMVNPADTPYLAVMCHDLATNRDPALVPLEAAACRQVAAVNGASRAWSTLPCAYWPVKAALPPRLLQARGVPPVLVIGTTYDPSTTVGWARALHRQLPDSRLVEWNGDGHLAYGRGGACVDQTVKRFFFEGVLPGQSLRCP
jgi:pimeloyl-ACP methyl ester carboxylesterase